jgi:hypothetical protein
VFSVHLHLHCVLVCYHSYSISYFLVCVLPSCSRLVPFFSFLVLLPSVVCSVLHYLCMVCQFLSSGVYLCSLFSLLALNWHPRCFLALSFSPFFSFRTLPAFKLIVFVHTLSHLCLSLFFLDSRYGRWVAYLATSNYLAYYDALLSNANNQLT